MDGKIGIVDVSGGMRDIYAAGMFDVCLSALTWLACPTQI